jgi:hypothetical protein
MSNGNPADQHDEGAVLLEQKEAIALITLSHPAALNALTWTMYQQIEAHLEHLYSFMKKMICSFEATSPYEA